MKGSRLMKKNKKKVSAFNKRLMKLEELKQIKMKLFLVQKRFKRMTKSGIQIQMQTWIQMRTTIMMEMMMG